MRNLFALSAAFASLFGGGVAFAQQPPLDPYVAAPPAAEPAPEYPVQIQPQQPVYPEQPYQAPPPVQTYAPPPPQVVYPAPGQNPGYYYPPTGYAAPIYSYPPPATIYVQPVPVRRVRQQRRCYGGSCYQQQPAGPRPRMFSVGARLSALGIDQQINDKDVILGGAGLQLRFRTRGRFGLEGAIDFLHGSFDAPAGAVTTPGTAPMFHVDKVTRDSIPVSLSLMLYVFPNQNDRVFNLYFLGGVGGISTTMGLTDENGAKVKQQFTEWEGHLGLGAELRFNWIALQADVRGLALTRDDGDKPSSYYTGVDGAPVPAQSFGVMGNVGATIWF
jgi:Outer membrane protein beta-barrel domain